MGMQASLFGYQEMTAESDGGHYRWSLTRAWQPAHAARRAAVVMLNPSTADERVDDPTIRILIRNLRELGFGGFEVVNLFAFRTPDPKHLRLALDPVGALNSTYLRAAISRMAPDVIVAWGARPEAAPQVMELLEWRERLTRVIPWKCFGTTKDGSPMHPLQRRAYTPELQPWDSLTWLLRHGVRP